MNVIPYYIALFLLSLLLTGVVRHYALKVNMLDVPNQRSSHSIPTPRGGGAAIVCAYFVAVTLLFAADRLDMHYVNIALLGLVVALIGLWDDFGHIAARWRFLAHFLASMMAVALMSGFPVMLIGVWRMDLAGWGYLIGAIFLTWLLNLFNFMDGTDGIAASEALFVSASLAIFVHDIDSQLFVLTISLAAASAGFLFWNWPAARIFMGDVGSGFLGLMIGLLILLAAWRLPVLFWAGLILMGVFIVDASYTLLYRVATGQKWYQAHCSHCYQHAAKQYGHLKVLMATWVINLCWLLPWSVWAFYHPLYAEIALLLAYSPLFYLVFRFKAGHEAVL